MSERYEYGIFAADKEKVCSANGIDPDNEEDWAFLWDEPFDYVFNEPEAQRIVDRINADRAHNGILDKYGPVKYRRRVATMGDWEDVPDEGKTEG